MSVAQLRAMGLDCYAVRRRVVGGYLHPLYRKVYAVGHRSLSMRGMYRAAVLACGPGAALSHRSAADLLDILAGTRRLTVTVPRSGVGPSNLQVHRSRMCNPTDFTERDGIRVTSVARTLLDLAGGVSPQELARAVDRSERLGFFDLGAVEEVLGRARGRRGAAALREAIAAWKPRYTRSELEERFQELLTTARLPAPEVNVLLWGEKAQHEVDALWPTHRLVVQLDGFAYHRTRADRERDASTDADLELAGFRVVRLTWDEVTVHPHRTVRRLRVIGAGK